MKFSGFRIDRSSRAGGESRLESVAGQMEKESTAEDKITDLFVALRNSIFSYLVAVFGRGSANDIEDITQDAFLQLHRYLQKGHEIENPRAWLFRVAHNNAVNRIKTRQFIAPLDDLEWEAICQKLPDPGITPEQRTQRLEDFAIVHEAMKRLSLAERQCLHLRAEGLRYKEIGDILNMSVPSVGKALRKAIKKLMLENAEEDAVH
jgi:RNA polymerase sigma-70 factor (ECF subfamily)